jgi:hypothetical protein
LCLSLLAVVCSCWEGHYNARHPSYWKGTTMSDMPPLLLSSLLCLSHYRQACDVGLHAKASPSQGTPARFKSGSSSCHSCTEAFGTRSAALMSLTKPLRAWQSAACSTAAHAPTYIRCVYAYWRRALIRGPFICCD